MLFYIKHPFLCCRAESYVLPIDQIDDTEWVERGALFCNLFDAQLQGSRSLAADSTQSVGAEICFPISRMFKIRGGPLLSTS